MAFAASGLRIVPTFHYSPELTLAREASSVGDSYFETPDWLVSMVWAIAISRPRIGWAMGDSHSSMGVGGDSHSSYR